MQSRQQGCHCAAAISMSFSRRVEIYPCDGGFAPAPLGFSALVPLPIWELLAEHFSEKGDAIASPGSVEATESALGLPPGIALSSAQSGLILPRAG